MFKRLIKPFLLATYEGATINKLETFQSLKALLAKIEPWMLQSGDIHFKAFDSDCRRITIELVPGKYKALFSKDVEPLVAATAVDFNTPSREVVEEFKEVLTFYLVHALSMDRDKLVMKSCEELLALFEQFN